MNLHGDDPYNSLSQTETETKLSSELTARIRNAAIYFSGLTSCSREEHAEHRKCTEMNSANMTKWRLDCDANRAVAYAHYNQKEWDGRHHDGETYPRSVEASCADLKERSRDIGGPCSIGRPMLREPAKSLLKTTDRDVGAGLQRAEFLSVVENPRGYSRERDALDLSIPARDAKQFVDC